MLAQPILSLRTGCAKVAPAAENALENCEASPTCDPGEPNPLPAYDCTGQSNALASAQAALQAADDDLQRCQDALSTAQDNLDGGQLNVLRASAASWLSADAARIKEAVELGEILEVVK